AGCLTGLYVFPRMVEVLTSFASSEDSTILQASYYFDFVFKIVLATGIAFVLPVILVMLNSMGLLSARTIAKAWRVSIVGIVVFAALVTPAADVLSMVFVAAPMVLLFLAALAVAWVHDRRHDGDEAEIHLPSTEWSRTCWACTSRRSSSSASSQRSSSARVGCPTMRRSSVNWPDCCEPRSTSPGTTRPSRWVSRTDSLSIRASTIRVGSSGRRCTNRPATPS